MTAAHRPGQPRYLHFTNTSSSWLNHRTVVQRTRRQTTPPRHFNVASDLTIAITTGPPAGTKTRTHSPKKATADDIIAESGENEQPKRQRWFRRPVPV